MQKRGCNTENLNKIIHLLEETGTLPVLYHPHKLVGNYANLWGCHIQPDWLLVWEQREQELILILIDTGTHADLFG